MLRKRYSAVAVVHHAQMREAVRVKEQQAEPSPRLDQCKQRVGLLALGSARVTTASREPRPLGCRSRSQDRSALVWRRSSWQANDMSGSAGQISGRGGGEGDDQVEVAPCRDLQHPEQVTELAVHGNGVLIPGP
jgi:hypothetical protein